MRQATLGSPYRNSDLFAGYYLDEWATALIRTFVPVAVDEAGGFAGFRETGSYTNSFASATDIQLIGLAPGQPA